MQTTLTSTFTTKVVKPNAGVGDQASGFVATLVSAADQTPVAGVPTVAVGPTDPSFVMTLTDMPGAYQISLASLDVNGALVSGAALSAAFEVEAGVTVPATVTVTLS